MEVIVMDGDFGWLVMILLFVLVITFLVGVVVGLNMNNRPRF